jgi:hypothetical protein
VSLAFCFQYAHTLKGGADQVRLMVQDRAKHRTLAHTTVNMGQILQAPFSGELVLRGPTGQPCWRLQASLLSYPQEVDSPQEAQDWEASHVAEAVHAWSTATQPAAPASEDDEGTSAPPDERESPGSEPAPPDPALSPAAVASASIPAALAGSEGDATLAQRISMSRARGALRGVGPVRRGAPGGGGVLQQQQQQQQQQAMARAPSGFLEDSSSDDSSTSGPDEPAGALFEPPLSPKLSSPGSLASTSPALSASPIVSSPVVPLPARRPSLPASQQQQIDARPAATSSSGEHTFDAAGAGATTAATPAAVAPGTTVVRSEHQSLFVLVESQKRGGRRFEEACEASAPLAAALVPTRGAADVAAAAAAILAHLQARLEQWGERAGALRVVLAGSDAFVSEVMRSFVELLSKKPRGWGGDALRFFLVPAAKAGRKTELAQQIAQADATYRAVFASAEWQAALARREPLQAGERAHVEQAVRRYVDEAMQSYRLEIGEAFVTLASGSGPRAVPFLKQVLIGAEPTRASLLPREDLLPADLHPHEPVDLQLSYVTLQPGRGEEARRAAREEATSIKAPFQCVAVSRLTAHASAWRLGPPPPPLAMLLQWRDKKAKKVLGLGGSGQSKSLRINTVAARIAKLSCSPASDGIGFRVHIDGHPLDGVLLLNIAPTWGSHVKAFPVACFTAAAAAATAGQ